MPPKLKFTREEIISAAVNIVREQGMSALTARSLASSLGSSPKPIFGLFKSMEEVQAEVMNWANALYQSYVREGMSGNKYPPYKASGMAYIQFARDEKELFKLLFMRDRTGENPDEGRDELRPVLEILMGNFGMTEEMALLFHTEMWIYVHGIATMIATSYLDWDMEFVSKSLTDVYLGLRHSFTGGK